MGSKIKKTRHAYNVLLLRDNSTVSSFRLSGFKLKIFFFFILLLMLVTGLSVYGLHHYRTLYRAQTEENTTLTAQNKEMNTRLQRLAGVETFLQTARNTDPVVTSGNLAQAVPPPAASAADEATAVPTAKEIDSILDPSGSVYSTIQEAIHALDELQPRHQPANNPVPGDADVPSSPQDIAAHPAVIDNVRAVFPNVRAMRLHFDLRNGDSSPISGSCLIRIRMKNGQRHTLTPSPAGAMNFTINNFKTMYALFTLPDGVLTQDIATVEIIPQAQGFSPVTRAYQLSAIIQ